MPTYTKDQYKDLMQPRSKAKGKTVGQKVAREQKKRSSLAEQKASEDVPEVELLHLGAKKAGIPLKGSYAEIGCSPLVLETKDGRKFQMTIKELKK